MRGERKERDHSYSCVDRNCDTQSSHSHHPLSQGAFAKRICIPSSDLDQRSLTQQSKVSSIYNQVGLGWKAWDVGTPLLYVPYYLAGNLFNFHEGSQEPYSSSSPSSTSSVSRSNTGMRFPSTACRENRAVEGTVALVPFSVPRLARCSNPYQGHRTLICSLSFIASPPGVRGPRRSDCGW